MSPQTSGCLLHTERRRANDVPISPRIAGRPGNDPLTAHRHLARYRQQTLPFLQRSAAVRPDRLRVAESASVGPLLLRGASADDQAVLRQMNRSWFVASPIETPQATDADELAETTRNRGPVQYRQVVAWHLQAPYPQETLPPGGPTHGNRQSPDQEALSRVAFLTPRLSIGSP